MKFKPTQDYLLVLPHTRSMTDSPLYVENREKHCRGTVVAVGPGKKDKKGRLKPLDTQVGDVVAFGDGNFNFYPSYFEATEPGSPPTQYRIIQEGDVVGVLDEETALQAA